MQIKTIKDKYTVAFPCPQRLSEDTSILRHMQIAYLVFVLPQNKVRNFMLICVT